jgi:hypothetical protein
MPILLKLAVLKAALLLAVLTTAQVTSTTISQLEAVRVHTLESKTEFMNCALVASAQVTSKLQIELSGTYSGELRYEELRDEDWVDERGQWWQC